jgi:hypothetical protein
MKAELKQELIEYLERTREVAYGYGLSAVWETYLIMELMGEPDDSTNG